MYFKSKKKLKHIGKFQSHPQNMVFVTKSAVAHFSNLSNFLLSFWLCLPSFKWNHFIIVLFLCLLRFPASVLKRRRTLVSFEGTERCYCLFFLVLYFLPLQRQVQGLILNRQIVGESLAHVVRLRYFWWLDQSAHTVPMMVLLLAAVSGDIGPWRLPGDLPPVSGPLTQAQSDSMSGWRPLYCSPLSPATCVDSVCSICQCLYHHMCQISYMFYCCIIAKYIITYIWFWYYIPLGHHYKKITTIHIIIYIHIYVHI